MMAAVTMFGVGEVMMILLFGGGIGVPLGIPPGDEDPLMAKVAPEECLYYTSWAGMAEPDPDSKNQVEQLLAEPEVKHAIAELEKRLTKSLTQLAEEEGQPEAAAVMKHAPKLIKTLISRPAAVYVAGASVTPEGADMDAAMLVNLGEEAAEVRTSLETLQKTYLGEDVKTVEIAGAEFFLITLDEKVPPITWGVRGNYLLVGVGHGSIKGLLSRARTEPPKWLTDVGKQLPVKRRATVTYVNIQKAVETFAPMGGPEVKMVLDAMGLGNVTSMIAVTGLDEEGFVSRSRVSIDGVPKGVFTVVSDKPLTAEDLAPIPHDATLAVAVRADADKLFELFLSTLEKFEPRARAEIMEGFGEVKRELDIDVQGDVLKSLGDVWCVYNSPGEGGLVVTGLTGVVQLKDSKKLAAANEKFIAFARAQTDRMNEGRRRRRGPFWKEMKFAGQTIYYMTGIDNEMPFCPAWCIMEDKAILALFPQNIKAYLSRGDDYKSLAEAPGVAELMKQDTGPSILMYQDTKELVKLVYPIAQILLNMGSHELQREGIDVDVSLLPSAGAILPHLKPGVTAIKRTTTGIEFESHQSLPGGSAVASAPILGTLAISAVFAARSAAMRAQSMNNLRQIGLAMLNFESAVGRFPAAYSTDKDGKPLLSWRVHILPFIEESRLYEQFHLDEPWDSEHNKKLVAKMPVIYRVPNSKAKPGMTNYLAVRGKDSIIAAPADDTAPNKGAKGVRISQVKDGTARTVMVVEADDEVAVIWTKPDDYEYDPKNPAKSLGGLRDDGVFIALFCDCHVQVLSKYLDPKLLNAVFTRSGGEHVDLSRLHAHHPRGHDHGHDHGHTHAVDRAIEVLPPGAELELEELEEFVPE